MVSDGRALNSASGSHTVLEFLLDSIKLKTQAMQLPNLLYGKCRVRHSSSPHYFYVLYIAFLELIESIF